MGAEVLPYSTEVVGCSSQNRFVHSRLNDNTTTTTQPEQIFEINLNDLESDPNKIPKFPIWGLPRFLQDLITEGARIYGVPEDFFGADILSAIGGSLRKKVFHKDKYLNYPQTWLMIVSPSGIGKTEPLRKSFEPLEKLNSELNSQFTKELEEWKAECILIQNKRGSKKDQQPEPPRPKCQQIFIQDTTPEAMYKALSENEGITLYRDELAGWFADFGRYSKSGEIEHYLSIFNNAQITINRKSEEVRLINRPYLSIIGSIQPQVLAECLSNQKMIENGFVQRFLFVFPDNMEKAYPIDEVVNPELLSEYENFITHLCQIELQESVMMSNEAKSILFQFRVEITNKDRATQDDYLKAMYAKMEIYIIRLALIVHVAQLISGTGEAEISEETMRYCVDLCHYFIATGEKVHRLTSEPQRQSNAMSDGDLIRLVNQRYGIKNQTSFARAIGVSQQAISKHLEKK